MPAPRPSTAYGPNERPDAAPAHPNAIRRFREELRLTREEFADLLEVKVETLRTWEALKGGSKPHGDIALRMIRLAQRNNYPLTINEIYDRNGA